MTGLALLPMPALLDVITAPIHPDCFEYCELGQIIATRGIFLVSAVWLLIVLAIARSWREREPTLAAVSAVGASMCLSIVAARFLDVVSFETITQDILQLALVLGLGLQLPPVWRLARRVRASTLRRLVVGIMGSAVAVAALSLVLLGPDIFGQGPLVIFVAWIVVVAGLVVVTVSAWRERVEGPRTIGLLIAAGLVILLGLPAALILDDIGRIFFSFGIALLPLAWLWTAVSWLQRGRQEAAVLNTVHERV